MQSFRILPSPFPCATLNGSVVIGQSKLSRMRGPSRRSEGEHLKLGRIAVHPARAGFGDVDSLGEDAAGLAIAPPGVEQVDVEREHHAGPKLIADRLDGALIGLERVVAVARMFERGG